MNILGNNVQSDGFTACGRRIMRHSGSVNGIYYVDVKNDIVDPQRRSQIDMFVKGKVFCHSITGGVPDFTLEAGSVSLDRDTKAGKYMVTIKEDMTFWCVENKPSSINKESVSALKLALGESITIPFDQGHKLFLCDGTLSSGNSSVSGPVEVNSTAPKTLTAVTQCYGFVFIPR